MNNRNFAVVPAAAGLLLCAVAARATPVDVDFSFSYSGQSVSGRLVGLEVDATGSGTNLDPSSVLLFHVPPVTGLAATPANPYVFVPHTFERSTYFSGTQASTTPGVLGFTITNWTMPAASQNLLMIDASGDVTLVFNFGASLGGEGGTATYGIQAEEDALWPTVNTFVSFTVRRPPCPADVGVQGGAAGHDGALDNNDFIAFITLFFAGGAGADVGVQGGLTGHDGVLDNNDFIAFINLFFQGCP